MESVANLSFNICFLVPEAGEAAPAHQLINATISHPGCVFAYVCAHSWNSNKGFCCYTGSQFLLL